MKVAGGVIRLTQNQAALNRFCLSAPILSSLTQQFLEKNNIDVYNRKHHYELKGTSSQRTHKNVDQLVECMKGLTPLVIYSMYILNLFYLIIEKSDLLKHDEIGNELH